MKQSGICPKCGSSDIIRIDGWSGAYNSGNNIPYGATVFSAAKVNRYLCCSCGFSEEWIDQDDIQKLLKKYGNQNKKK